MSKDQGRPAPPAGGYGPGKTVLAHPSYVDESEIAVEPIPAPDAGAPIPPTTVRDPEASASPPQFLMGPQAAPNPARAEPAHFAMGPQAAPNPASAEPAHYSSPDFGAPPYDAGYAAPLVPPVGVPPPPRARGRRRTSSGPSLVVIGVAATLVIGTGATLIAMRSTATSDDKPMPTIDVPAPASVPPDPTASAAPPPDPPAATDPPPRRTKPKSSASPGGGRPPMHGGRPNINPRLPPPPRR